MLTFRSAWQKLCRAQRFIDEFGAELKAYEDSCPYRLLCDARYNSEVHFLTFEREFPAFSMMAAGDAIHSMRVALDHCMFSMLMNDQPGRKADGIYFPTSKTANDRQAYRAKIAKIGCLQDVADMLENLEAFPGGSGDALFDLHQFDITDKHRVLIATMEQCEISGLTEHHNAVGNAATTTSLLTKSYALTVSEGVGSTFGAHLGMAMLGQYSKGPDGPKLDTTAAHVRPIVTFREAIGPSRGVSIIELLNRWCRAVSETIEKFEDIPINRVGFANWHPSIEEGDMCVRYQHRAALNEAPALFP